jgi:hypothetical protein
MNKNFFWKIITLAIALVPIISANDYRDNQNMDARHNANWYASELHHTLNSITNKPHPHLYAAINATSNQQIKEYFGNDVTRQDLLDFNKANNDAKHDWDKPYGWDIKK